MKHLLVILITLTIFMLALIFIKGSGFTDFSKNQCVAIDDNLDSIGFVELVVHDSSFEACLILTDKGNSYYYGEANCIWKYNPINHAMFHNVECDAEKTTWETIERDEHGDTLRTIKRIGD